mmetsp:Transcript_8767/g.17750  ORF Transcript_8767/g.17750 Transcript_8767/m.17750 type:complete len:253 (+) Transcript_8767:1224-1982(+)
MSTSAAAPWIFTARSSSDRALAEETTPLYSIDAASSSFTTTSRDFLAAESSATNVAREATFSFVSFLSFSSSPVSVVTSMRVSVRSLLTTALSCSVVSSFAARETFSACNFVTRLRITVTSLALEGAGAAAGAAASTGAGAGGLKAGVRAGAGAGASGTEAGAGFDRLAKLGTGALTSGALTMSSEKASLILRPLDFSSDGGWSLAWLTGAGEERANPIETWAMALVPPEGSPSKEELELGALRFARDAGRD